jgi:hypothetical protein
MRLDFLFLLSTRIKIESKNSVLERVATRFTELLKMPNYCENFVYVEGDEAERTAFLEKIVGGFSFESFYPTPAFESDEEVMEWCEEHWGCKRDVENVCEPDLGEDMFSLHFTTCWNVPLEFFQQITKDYPSLKIHITYKEESPEVGFYYIENGEIEFGYRVCVEDEDDEEPMCHYFHRCEAALQDKLSSLIATRVYYQGDIISECDGDCEECKEYTRADEEDDGSRVCVDCDKKFEENKHNMEAGWVSTKCGCCTGECEEQCCAVPDDE